MTIHAFAGEKASRTHENQMLQRFLERIEERWMQSSDWIYVIANTMWEGSEIDLVCLLPSMIFVADFKDYQGRISGTENGPWLADGVPIKGGAQKNPFVQLRKNRFSVMDWLGKRANLEGRNLGHLSAGVIFSGPILDGLDISQRSKSWFYVTDLDGAVKTLDALASPQLMVRREEADQTVQALGVTTHIWQSSRPAVIDLGGRAPRALEHPLTEHQKEAMAAVERFLKSKDHRSMSVAGMTSTGKSRLLVEVIEVVARQGRNAIPLSPNSRLAYIVGEDQGARCESVYQHLYLNVVDNDSTSQVRTEAASENAPVASMLKTENVDTKSRKKSGAPKVIPLRECTDPDDCVYLIDDAHLLSDSPFVTPDGKQYGSGRLLSDLFAFGDFAHSARQIIFFADPYQLQRAAPTDSVMDGSFQSRHELGHVTLPLEQLIDVSHGGALLRNALSLVNAIRTGKFASLSIIEDESVRIVDSKTAAQELVEHFRSNPFSAWYLADTHAKLAEFVRWLRPRLFGVRRLGALEAGDLLEVVSVQSPEDRGGGNARQVRAGQRYCVDEIGTSQDISQPLKGRQQPITFHLFDYVTLNGPGILALERPGSLGRFLEDYITAEKPELLADTAVAVRVWVNARKAVNRGSTQVDDRRGDAFEVDEEVGVSGVSLARYGYGATVHHAQGMSQPLCYVNAEHAAGRHSDAYFRWLYTALTTVGRTLTLFNFTPIHPFDSATWNETSASVADDIPVGSGWAFSPDAGVSQTDQRRDVPPGLGESRNLKASVAIWLSITRAAETLGWFVSKATCHAYQELYELKRGDSERCELKVAYSGKNVVTALHIVPPTHWDVLRAIAAACIDNATYTPIARDLLCAIRAGVGASQWWLVSASETSYRLSIVLVRQQDERVCLEINFDKQGLATTVRPLKYSKPELLEEVQGLMR